MVRLEDSWTSLTPDHLKETLETQHLILKCWTDRVYVPRPKGHYEYETWSEIGQVYKVRGQYFVDLDIDSRPLKPLSLEDVYHFVMGHIKQCNGHNGLDIVEVDNTPDWVLDNQ